MEDIVNLKDGMTQRKRFPSDVKLYTRASQNKNKRERNI